MFRTNKCFYIRFTECSLNGYPDIRIYDNIAFNFDFKSRYFYDDETMIRILLTRDL